MTPLPALFGRLRGETPAQRAALPVPRLASEPQLLGFAEPVANVPPIDTFLPGDEESAPPIADTAEIAVRETASSEPPPEPELEALLEAQPEPTSAQEATPEPRQEPGPALETMPEPEPVSEAEPIPEPEPVPEPPPLVQARMPNLVGRLGRLPDEAHLPEAAPLPTDPSPPAPLRGASERPGHPPLSRNRRAYRRARVPAEIEIGGVPCTLIDVSIGGFAATSVPPLDPNALVQVTIRLVIDAIEVGTQLSARIAYVTRGRSAGRFIDLSPSQMAFLRYIVTWRGESVGAVGTTTLLDAIAGGADRGFMPGAGERGESDGKSRWWTGLIGRKVSPPR